ACCAVETIDEIDDVEEAAARTTADAGAGNGDGQMGLSGSCAADKHDVALFGQEAAGGEIADQRLVDWRTFEAEVVNILGQRQLGDGELVFDRTRLLLTDLGLQ